MFIFDLGNWQLGISIQITLTRMIKISKIFRGFKFINWIKKGRRKWKKKGIKTEFPDLSLICTYVMFGIR